MKIEDMSYLIATPEAKQNYLNVSDKIQFFNQLIDKDYSKMKEDLERRRKRTNQQTKKYRDKEQEEFAKENEAYSKPKDGNAHWYVSRERKIELQNLLEEQKNIIFNNNLRSTLFYTDEDINCDELILQVNSDNRTYKDNVNKFLKNNYYKFLFDVNNIHNLYVFHCNNYIKQTTSTLFINKKNKDMLNTFNGKYDHPIMKIFKMLYNNLSHLKEFKIKHKFEIDKNYAAPIKGRIYAADNKIDPRYNIDPVSEKEIKEFDNQKDQLISESLKNLYRVINKNIGAVDKVDIFQSIDESKPEAADVLDKQYAKLFNTKEGEEQEEEKDGEKVERLNKSIAVTSKNKRIKRKPIRR